MTGPLANEFAQVREARESWEARCHFCGGPSFPWLTADETWAKVAAILGQQQACFECFAAAWFVLGLNHGEPFQVLTPAALARIEEHTHNTEKALRRIEEMGDYVYKPHEFAEIARTALSAGEGTPA